MKVLLAARVPRVLRRALTGWLVTLLLCGLSAPVAAQSGDHPALWRVSNGESTVYLFGTLHFLPRGHFPLAEVIEDAVTGADHLVLELDLNNIDQQELQQVMFSRGINTDGRRLSTIVGETRWREVRGAIDKLRLQPVLFEGMRPWLAALTLTAASFGQVGMTAEQGVETYLLDLAGDNVRVSGLESVRAQVEVFTDLAEEDQVRLLMQTVRRVDEVEQFAMDAVSAWESGNIERLQGFLLEVYANEPALYDALITRRHDLWMPQIKALLERPGTHFVAVGALHLTGEDGLLRGLERAGHRPQRVRGDAR